MTRAIDAALGAIAAAVAAERDQDGTWGLGKERFYRISQTTFATRVLLWSGRGSHADAGFESLDWLSSTLRALRVPYTRTYAWPLFLFADATPLSWRSSEHHLVDRLLALQNPDGSWGHGTNAIEATGSGPAHALPTSLAILGLCSCSVLSYSLTAAIRAGVSWLWEWLGQHRANPERATSALALYAVSRARTHQIPQSEISSRTHVLALGTAEALPLNIEAIPDAARHLDSPYLLHTPAWLLFVLASLGSDSTFRLQLSLLRQVMSCIQADGRAGLTSDDSEPAIYTTFNVYSACKAFADRFGGDQLLDVFIERPEVLETMDKGVRSDRSMVFVGSSVEGLGVARALQANFERDTFDAVLWEQSVFDPSATAIESLERVCAEADFAVLVLTPDDTVSSRGDAHPAMRDNVLFELGLFIGALGRNRVFIVQPRASMKKPSDLLGITTIDYDPVRMASAPRAALGPASDAVRRRISELGRR